MNFFKNKNVAIALTLCAMLAAGSQTVYAVQVAAPLSAHQGNLYNVTSKTPMVLNGTIEDVAVDLQGRTVWMVRKAGAKSNAPLIQVTIEKKTAIDKPKDIGNGTNISVEYTGNNNAKIVAKKVTTVAPISDVVEIGEVVELIEGGAGADGGFRLRPINKEIPKGQDPAMNDIIFRYNAETDMGITAKDIKIGTQLAVTYGGVLTRSLPPQGFASAIADFNAPATLDATALTPSIPATATTKAATLTPSIPATATTKAATLTPAKSAK